MKIQKGMVKYKDRNDIICIYGVTDAGKTYYFLNNDGKSFANGNYVASTELVEAIDPMYKASKVGVIDSEGKEVIPCENKGIKPITDNVILVEKAVPTTESVLQAIERRSDSLYAAQLVSTPAQIKDSIYREMGNDGRFLFNDQFAEATIYDINGNNLVNGEVYSFIAMNNDHLYFSKNVPESPIVHFSLGENKIEDAVGQSVQEETIQAPAPEPPVEVNESKEQIDVNNVSVPMDVVEKALEGQATEAEHNVIQDNFDVDTHTPLENVNEGLELPSTDDFMAATNVGIPVVHEDAIPAVEAADEQPVEDVTVETPAQEEVVVEEVVTEENIPTVDEAMAASETVEAVEDIVPNIDDVEEHVNAETASVEGEETAETEEVVEDTVVDETSTEETSQDAVEAVDEVAIPETVTEKIVEEVVAEETPAEEVFEEFVDVTDQVVEETAPEEFVTEDTQDVTLDIGETAPEEVFEENVVEETPAEEEEKEAPLAEEDIQTLLDETSMDLFGGAPLQIDSIVNGTGTDELDNYTFTIPETSSSDNLFDDVAKSMADLIRQVREQRATIANYEEIIDGLNADKAELQGKVTAVEHHNVELSDRSRTLENAVIKLKTRIEMLASKLHEKDEVIDRQSKELKELREQSAGKAQLLSLLRDAQALVNDANAVDDVEDYSYIKAA